MADTDLSSIEDIMNKLPLVIPRGEIAVTDEQYRYRSGKDEYFIRRAPVSSVSEITGTLNGSTGHTFVEDTDYEIVDVDSVGDLEWNVGQWDNNEWTDNIEEVTLDTVDWSIGGDTPDDGTDFFIDYRCTSVISRYVGEHDSDVDAIEDDINSAIKAAQVANATGDDLGRVGSLLGIFGRRRGRNDSSYRSYLQTVVPNYDGKGMASDVKFAVSAGIEIDESDITLTEDTDNTQYTVELTNWPAHSVSTVETMAEVSDPSGVKYSDTQYNFDTEEMGADDAASTQSATSISDDTGIDDSASTPSPTSASEDVGSDDSAATPSPTSALEGVSADDSTTIAEHGLHWDSAQWETMRWT